MSSPHCWPPLIIFKLGLFLTFSIKSASPEYKRQGGEGLLKNHESANKLQMPIRSTESEELELISGSFKGWPHTKVGQKFLSMFHCDNRTPSSKTKALGQGKWIWMQCPLSLQLHTHTYRGEHPQEGSLTPVHTALDIVIASVGSSALQSLLTKQPTSDESKMSIWSGWHVQLTPPKSELTHLPSRPL